MLKEICESLWLNVDEEEKAIDRANIPGCWGVFVLTGDSSLIEQLRRQLRGKINVHSDVLGVPRFACSSINNVTQITRHCGTNDGHVLVVARAIYTTNFMKLQQDNYKRFSENKYLLAW